jgi:hypothetical protein
LILFPNICLKATCSFCTLTHQNSIPWKRLGDPAIGVEKKRKLFLSVVEIEFLSPLLAPKKG